MEQSNGNQPIAQETQVVGSIKVISTDYKVQRPVFTDVKVDRPVFVDKVIEIPSGWDKVINELALEISNKIMDKVDLIIGARLDRAIDHRVKEIKSPKIIEQVTIVNRDVEVERPIFKDVEVSRPTFVDKEVINPVLKDVSVTNAKIEDMTVINAVIVDQKVTNAIIKDVDVEKAIIRERVIDVIHPRYLDLQGREVS